MPFNPQPKPPKRGPKPRKPLPQRSKPLRGSSPLRMVTLPLKDAASFRQADIAAVWGNTPLCLLTLRHECDLHHVLGRGEYFGFKKTSPERAYFSSPLNAVPLCRDVHNGPLRDNRYMRRMFLAEARMRVMNAVGAGEYTLTDNDYAFLQIMDQYLADTP